MQQNYDNDRNKQLDEMREILLEWMYLLLASDCLEVKQMITEDHIEPLRIEIKELEGKTSVIAARIAIMNV